MTSHFDSTSSLSRATVQWWDWSSIYVRCPNCDEIHVHHFDGRPGHYERPMRRSSDCYTTGRYQDCCIYQITFPFDTSSGEVNYEIDKHRAIFVCGTADPDDYYRAREGDDSGLTSDDFKDRRKWTEATEMVHESEADTGIPGGFSIERMAVVVTALYTGRVYEVRQYLESSADAEIFLHGVEAHRIPQFDSDSNNSHDGTGSTSSEIVETIKVTGRTALHFAACEESSHMVELLLSKGANPNAIDMDGRAPLMEAALWGRIENVKLLLKYHADKDIHCLRRGKRVLAADFARSLDKSNREERHRRTEGVYKEDTYERDEDRKRIFRLLSGGPEEPPPTHRAMSSFAFTRSMDDPTRLTLVTNFDIPSKWKTVAVLHRDGNFPAVAAMSGWAHGDDAGVRVGGREWTAEVLRLCNFIGYPLPVHERDQGVPGQYHACHAEKQLVAYLVNKHVFLPGEVDDELPDISGLSLSEHPDDGDEEQQELVRRHKEELFMLREFEPPVTLKKAKILVCRPVCGDCWEFVERVNSALGLKLTVFHRCLDSDCWQCRS